MQFDRRKVIFGVMAMLVVYFIVQFFISQRVEEVKLSLESQINLKLEEMREGVRAIGRTPSLPKVEQLIPECDFGERVEADDLLSKLDQGLPSSKIARLDRVFASCGSVLSERRGVAVLLFEEQLKALEDLTSLKLELLKENEDNTDLVKWRELLEIEKSINANLYKLVGVQRQIISILQTNLTDRSQLEILQVEAITTNNEMSQNSARATKLRSELLGS